VLLLVVVPLATAAVTWVGAASGAGAAATCRP
jgi:hypothetical protein